MNDDLGKIREVFKEEVRELLTDLETSLLELENMPDNKESIGRIFRAMHTIKGASSMFGYDTITRITHEAESIFDMVRKGKIKVTKELIDLTLPIIDHIMGSIKKTGSDESADEAKTEIILSAFKKFSAKPGQANSSAHTGPIVQTDHCLSESTGRKITYRICFRPARNIFLKGINPVIPLNELCRMGRCSIVARTDIIPELDIIDPEAFYIYWDIILTATKNLQAVTELFTLFKDDYGLTIVSPVVRERRK
jgi:two-component system, chemotaxis family, sensor kinase CheA